MKRKATYIKVSLDMFGQDVYVFYGQKKRATLMALREMAGLENVTIDDFSRGQSQRLFDDKTGVNFFFLWTEKREACVLLHEISHTCHEVLSLLGIKEKRSNEVFCYMAGYIFKEVMREDKELKNEHN